MKKLLFICALFLGVTPMISAQEASTTKTPTAEEYKTMIENHYNVKFREMAFEALGLTEEEIIKMDPIYKDYTSAKMDLIDRRNQLIEKYRDEMQEDDDAEEKEDETADFIENYWETQIKEMELKKDYFDRFEDVVSNEKAISFFLLEEKMQSRVEEVNLIGIVPMMIDVREYHSPYMKDKMHDKKKKHDKKMKEDSSMNWEEDDDASMNTTTTKTETANWTSDQNKMTEKSEKEWSTKTATTTSGSDAKSTEKKDWDTKGTATYTSNNAGVNSFNSWIEKEGKGVSLSHSYTANGLEALVTAIYAVADQHGVKTDSWTTKKDRVMAITKELQKDPNSTDHADIAREAFGITAAMFNAIQTEKGTDKTKGFATQVESAANAINPDRLMTDQANDIYAFFSYANQALKAFSGSEVNYKNTSASTQNK